MEVFDNLVLSTEAFLLGITFRAALAFYTIYPAGLWRKFSPATVTGMGHVLGGLIMVANHETLGASRDLGCTDLLAFGYIKSFRNSDRFLLISKLSKYYWSDPNASLLM